MAAVSLPRIVGDGQAEARWQASHWLQHLPVREADSLLSPHRRLVVVSPHPDDETLACGGLLHAAAHAGLEVLMVAVTDGEACYPDDASWTRTRLRAQRMAELAEALRTLGVEAQVRRLQLPDGGVSAASAPLRVALSMLVQPGDLVLAPWEQDGHPDHDAAGAAALAATADAGGTLLRYPVWAWHWLDPAAAQAPFDALRVPLTATAQVAKRAAIDCFGSQLGTVRPAVARPILPAHVLARFQRPFEVYLP